MRKKYLIIAFTVFFIFAVSSCNKYRETATVSKNEVKSLPVFNVVNSSSSESDKLTINTILEDNDNYKISVNYPLTSFQDLNTLIGNLINPYIEDYRQQIADKADDTKYDLNIDCDIIKYTDSLMSFKFNIDLLGNKKICEVKTLTLDLENGTDISIKDVFKQDTDYKDIMSKNIPLDVLKRHSFINNDIFSNFVIDEDSITVYFQPQTNSKDADYFKIKLNSIKSNLSSIFNTFKNFGDKKLVALTFDDGPNPITTPNLLDGLAERNIKATFFMLGQRIEENPDIIKRMYEEGHDIGNHSYGHANMVKLNTENAKFQYNRPNEILNSIIGTPSIAFRPPYGSFNDNTKQIVDAPIILWNIDPNDWKYRDAETVANHIIQRAKDGDIILLHDIYQTSVDAAFKVMDTLTEQGFEFVTVSELIRRNGDEPEVAEVFSYQRKDENLDIANNK